MERIGVELRIPKSNLAIFSRKTQQKCLKTRVEREVVNARVK